MKNKKIGLLIMLLLIPTVVFARANETTELTLVVALGIEAFITIHMSVFVLFPISTVFDPDKTKKLFWKMFAIRIIILLFFDFFVSYYIALFDFVLVFIGAFIIVPILFAIQRAMNKNSDNISEASILEPLASVILKCTNCGSILDTTDELCPNCKMPFSGNNVQVESKNTITDQSPIVIMDHTYLEKEENILKGILLEELKNHGETEKSFITPSTNTKKNILLGIFAVVTLIIVIMFYFNYPLIICLGLEVFMLLVYYLINKKLNIVNVLIKEVKKKPENDISEIVNNVINEKHNSIVNDKLKFVIAILLVLVLPTIYFFNPRILYTTYGEGYSVFRYTRGIINKSEVTIPAEHKGKKVLAIGEQAFANSNIETVNLPIGLEIIQSKAFYNCANIETIDIPYTVEAIRGNAFENSSKLTTVMLHEGLKEIRGGAFKNAVSLKNIELPNSLVYLGGSAFSHCSSLVTITIPEQVTEINGQTFEYCTSLEKINMHDNIVSIHGEVFIGDTKLNDVVLPSKITEIRGNTFEGCTSLTSIVIPEGVTRIGGHAFYGCSRLSYVYIPQTVLEIGSSAFRQCTSLKTINVPSNTYINERAFKESPTVIKRY